MLFVTRATLTGVCDCVSACDIQCVQATCYAMCTLMHGFHTGIGPPRSRRVYTENSRLACNRTEQVKNKRWDTTASLVIAHESGKVASMLRLSCELAGTSNADTVYAVYIVIVTCYLEVMCAAWHRVWQGSHADAALSPARAHTDSCAFASRLLLD